MEKIVLNEKLIRKVVYGVNKAVTIDVPQEKRDHPTETSNRFSFAYGDFINDNLRKHAVDDNHIELIPFKRYSWEGRILADHEHKITYTICSMATLKAAAQKHGVKPYYLLSLLFAENGDCEGTSRQYTLADYCPDFDFKPYTDDELTKDYNDIMQGRISIGDGYRHYIIGYKAERSEIKDVRLIFLDKDYCEVESVSLMDYVTPDFAALTATAFNEADENAKSEEIVASKSGLFKVKPGVKPALRAEEERA